MSFLKQNHSYRMDTNEMDVEEVFHSYLSNSEEISDEALEKACGGMKKWGSTGYVNNPKDIVYEFHVGDRVETKSIRLLGKRGTVVKCFAKFNGEHYEPIYEVKLDEGTLQEFSQCFVSDSFESSNSSE